jgi:kynurenine formamidase
LNETVFGYGNGERFKKEVVSDMCCGSTSNNSKFSMPTHFGTHIDFPFHFYQDGKNSSQYEANDFVFDEVGIIELSNTESIDDYLIRNSHLDVSAIDTSCEILFIKTGFCNKRSTDEYWNFGFGFHSETAAHLKEQLPNLKAIAFDLISLNSYQNRPMGRIAHKNFLADQDILIIEEVDLRDIDEKSKINQVIVACLQLENADGAPCTIFANIHED